MLLTGELKKWVTSMVSYLRKQWGLDAQFARDVSIFYLYLSQYGLSPTITSGYRSPDKQAALQSRYSAGDSSVIVQPAKNSLHTRTTASGDPAALAIDVSCSDYNLAARIATTLGIGAGLYFRTPDRVHFYDKRG
jgi:uncharacterized protein YcbK (DUF882 family)